MNDCYFTVRDGLRLHYRDYCDDESRPTLLCLPGLTRNARDFADFAKRYSPSFRVVALEFRGRAQSDYDPDPSRYHPLTYARDVLELLDHLKLDRAIFIGTSLGGLVTMTVAALQPERIAATILNDVGPELSAEGLERIKGYVGQPVRFRNWDEAALRIAENNGNLPVHYEYEDWLKMARRTCREEDGGVVFDYDMAVAQPFNSSGAAPVVDMWPLFRALARKPLLIVRGEQSDLLSAAAVDKMLAEAPGTKLVTVPGAGHAPDLNEPEAAAAIDDFLADPG